MSSAASSACSRCRDPEHPCAGAAMAMPAWPSPRPRSPARHACLAQQAGSMAAQEIGKAPQLVWPIVPRCRSASSVQFLLVPVRVPTWCARWPRPVCRHFFLIPTTGSSGPAGEAQLIPRPAARLFGSVSVNLRGQPSTPLFGRHGPGCMFQMEALRSAVLDASPRIVRCCNGSFSADAVLA